MVFEIKRIRKLSVNVQNNEESWA